MRLFALLLVTAVKAAAATRATTAAVDAAGGLDGLVLFGLQCWFGTDTAFSYGWNHWSRDGQGAPDANSLIVDFLVNTAEFSQTYPTPMGANLYSCADGSSVETQVRWLQDYNLDGFFLQRFVNEVQDQSGPAYEFRNAVTQHLSRHIPTYGRVWAVEYDISGADAGRLMQSLQNDWAFFSKSFVSLNNGYLHQNGKPVVAIWGFGFTDREPSDPAACLAIVQWFQSQGCYVVGGVPFFWRSGTGDSRPGFESVYAAYDSVTPWSVGRYSSSDFPRLFREMQKDRAALGGRSYAPTIWPGFSFHNSNSSMPLNQISRECGGFLVQQQTAVIEQLKPSWIFLAMFDECNEGTCMFKTAPTNSSLPDDLQGRMCFLQMDRPTCQDGSDAYLIRASRLTAAFKQSHGRKNKIVIV